MVHSTSLIHNSNRFASSFIYISSDSHAHSLFINSPLSLSLPFSSSPSGLSPLSSSPFSLCCKHDVQRSEALKIILDGSTEFEAIDVVLQGNHVFGVLDGYKLKITSGSTGIATQLNPIEQRMMDSGSWHWDYKIVGTDIQLALVES